jgi:DNA-binding transcriptional LysR family regulator
LSDREQVTWEEVGQVPLCLLTPDTQTRRIIDGRLREAGTEPAPLIESDSMIVLYAHVRTGRWSTIMPGALVKALGFASTVRSIPIHRDERKSHNGPDRSRSRSGDPAHRSAHCARATTCEDIELIGSF